MKNPFKKYFLYVAEKPAQRAFETAIGLFVILLIARAIIGKALDVSFFSADQIFRISLIAFMILTAINAVIPVVFITYFFKENRQIVLVRDSDDPDSSTIYCRPIWGRVPYVKIFFPADWNVNDDSYARQLDLKVIFKITPTMLAFLNIKTRFYFNGNFQATDLMEMIRQQGNSAKGETLVHFGSCLQKIVIDFLADRRELIKDDLKDWQQKKITTKDLEKKWFRPEIIFQNLFINVDKIEMTLNTPEIKKTREK